MSAFLDAFLGNPLVGAALGILMGLYGYRPISRFAVVAYIAAAFGIAIARVSA